MASRIWVLMVVALFGFFIPSLSDAADNLYSQPLSGPPPIIDGNKGTNEWTGSPTISLRSPYPIDADIYFRNDNQNLYVLVDALGDVHDDNWDECLPVFGLPPAYKVAEMWLDASSALQSNPGTIATAYAMGMTAGHRVYEFRIPFANLGIQPGQPIEFYSPKILKGPGWYGGASTPYDAYDGRDNVYPSDLQVTTGAGTPPVLTGVTNYSIMYTQTLSASIPTVSGWSKMLLSGLLVIGAVIALRRKVG